MQAPIIELTEEDFRRGYVHEPVPPRAPPQRRGRTFRGRKLRRVLGIVVLYSFVGVLAVVAWRGHEAGNRALTAATP